MPLGAQGQEALPDGVWHPRATCSAMAGEVEEVRLNPCDAAVDDLGAVVALELWIAVAVPVMKCDVVPDGAFGPHDVKLHNTSELIVVGAA